jgi:hypothetical protein
VAAGPTGRRKEHRRAESSDFEEVKDDLSRYVDLAAEREIVITNAVRRSSKDAKL